LGYSGRAVSAAASDRYWVRDRGLERAATHPRRALPRDRRMATEGASNQRPNGHLGDRPGHDCVSRETSLPVGTVPTAGPCGTLCCSLRDPDRQPDFGALSQGFIAVTSTAPSVQAANIDDLADTYRVDEPLTDRRLVHGHRLAEGGVENFTPASGIGTRSQRRHAKPMTERRDREAGEPAPCSRTSLIGRSRRADSCGQPAPTRAGSAVCVSRGDSTFRQAANRGSTVIHRAG